MNKREQLARKIVSFGDIRIKEMIEFCVADLLERYDEQDLED